MCEQLIERGDQAALDQGVAGERYLLVGCQGHAQAQGADNLTTRRLGYEPMSFDDGLRLLIPWLRGLGRHDPVSA